MKKDTYGGSKAAEELYNTLKRVNIKRWNAKCGSFLADYNLGVKQIGLMADTSTAFTMLELWRRNGVERIDSMEISREVKSFLKNIMTANTRRLSEKLKKTLKENGHERNTEKN